MEDFDIVGLQARDVATNFIMAINGAYFVSRKVGVQATAHDIELGKQNVQTASYLFNKNLKGLINIYDSGKDTQVAQARIDSVSVQLIKKANRAIQTGIGNGAAAMLGNNAHGGVGRLVARAAQTLDLSVVDSAGRTWKDPTKLIQTIVRDYHYQREVEWRINRLKEEGKSFFMVGEQGYSIKMFDELRSRLFHPNSPKLPEPFNV